MADCMTFPNDWHDFIKDYSFIDSKQVYTNGSELIQVFRVIQLIEHLLIEQEAVTIKKTKEHGFGVYGGICPKCNNWIQSAHSFCGFCGQAVKCE